MSTGSTGSTGSTKKVPWFVDLSIALLATVVVLLCAVYRTGNGEKMDTTDLFKLCGCVFSLLFIALLLVQWSFDDKWWNDYILKPAAGLLVGFVTIQVLVVSPFDIPPLFDVFPETEDVDEGNQEVEEQTVQGYNPGNVSFNFNGFNVPTVKDGYIAFKDSSGNNKKAYDGYVKPAKSDTEVKIWPVGNDGATGESFLIR